MINNSNKQTVFFIMLILAVASRLIPHPANFIPLGAFTIFAGSKLGKNYALVFVLSTMLITDIFLGFSFVSVFVYLGMTSYFVASYLIKKGYLSIFIAVLSGTTGFFIISNFGVWLGPWYPHTLPGLLNCYTLALPFFRNTFAADITFSVATFGLYGLYQQKKKGVSIWQNVLKKPILKVR